MVLNISTVLNIALILIGILLLVYGIRVKTRYLVIVGTALICFGLFSVGIDLWAGSAGNADTHRLAFVIGTMMK